MDKETLIRRLSDATAWDSGHKRYAAIARVLESVELLSPDDQAALSALAEIHAAWLTYSSDSVWASAVHLVTTCDRVFEAAKPIHSAACPPSLASDPSGRSGPAHCLNCHMGELTLLDSLLLVRCGCCGQEVRVSVGPQEGPS